MSAPAPPSKKGGPPPPPPAQGDGAQKKGAAEAKEDAGPKSFARRDHIRSYEVRVQKKWEDAKVYYTQSAFDASGAAKPKFMATFPYPYMNGRLHLGHAYSLTKAEFSVRFHRLLGENALFPFGFHCTGMPIQAAANKLKAELAMFGCPPIFPVAEDEDDKPPKEAVSAEAAVQNKSKGKKSKAVSKTGSGVVRQWDVLKLMVPEEEIPEFVDPMKWLAYFPPHGKDDLKRFGICTDWRRSFITTSVNPYYDSFIRWQFRLLKERGRVKFGKRPNVYSPLDGQVCADHDRASGEGVGPQEYTIIKLQVVEPFPAPLASLAGKKVFLGPATLRPETMFGQTNCFVLPEGKYGAFEMGNGDVLIISERSAKGLAHQDHSAEWGKVKQLASLSGWDLLGLPLKAPNAVYDVVYTLPLLTISMSKGTGVVTSVPSDAPDDYVALRELKDKPDFRAKFSLTDEMVMPFEVVPIIEIPGYGNMAAVTVSDELKIKSVKDTEKLKEAKERVYLKGFYEGVMLVGACAGMKVCDAKPIIKQDMLDKGQAMVYMEPESVVMSRSGDECVVALTDQWYLGYGEEDWKKRVHDHIHSDNFSAFSPSTLEQFDSKVAWLKEWACSRQFGLGTQLPWDEQWVIESLSDSTIYMAYYTIAHLLHGEDNLDGQVAASPAGISPDQLTDQVWSYIFLQGPEPTDSSLSKETLATLRREFEYWYPMDLRVSAKDLIPNHLTMALYNHTEVWRDRPELWPRGMFCNGHILVNAEKMSKSKGNFLMMDECVDKFTADATRLALADAGDTLDDANFALDTANSAILSLFNEEEWVRAVMADVASGAMRPAPSAGEEVPYMDRVFDNEMNKLITQTRGHFTRIMFREGLKSAWYEFQRLRDEYRDWSLRTATPLRQDLILRFIEAQAIMMAPITPHWSENIWEILGREGLVIDARWPTVPTVDLLLSRSYSFLRDSMRAFRLALIKAGKPEELKAHAYVAATWPDWQEATLRLLQAIMDERGELPRDFMNTVKERAPQQPVLKANLKNVMKFGAFVGADVRERGAEALELSLPFDQRDVLLQNLAYIKRSLGIQELSVHDPLDPSAPGPEDKKNAALPGKPSIFPFKA